MRTTLVFVLLAVVQVTAAGQAQQKGATQQPPRAAQSSFPRNPSRSKRHISRRGAQSERSRPHRGVRGGTAEDVQGSTRCVDTKSAFCRS